jgi:S-formylglutathione hydrolase FrmB
MCAHTETAFMTKHLVFVLGLAFSLTGQTAHGGIIDLGIGLRGELARVNRCLHGRVVDFTNNHGSDRRIWSPALCSRRDLYVYVPPGYDPAKKYPMGIFLHGAGQDERFFLKSLAQKFDDAIVSGELPPFIVVAPDGSMLGRPSYFRLATFFANTDAGRYEDYLMEDVWDFVMTNFSVRPERDAHILMGASMGGSAAFTQAIKHKHKVKVALGFMPALNLRWVDCHGRYEAPFDPDCWGWRTQLRPFEVVGRPKGIAKIRFRNLYGDLIGHGPDALAKLSRFNPIEVMDHYDLKPGELDLYVAYGGLDEFNIAAQAESFLYLAKERGLTIGVDYDPQGRHNPESGERLLTGALHWVAPLVERYRPAKK